MDFVVRETGTQGFTVYPRRWMVGRSFALLSRSRRLARAYERYVQTCETLIYVAVTRLLLCRLDRHPSV